MFNPNTNEISFPHVIPGCILGGKTHTYNSINGGIKVLSNMNLIRNRFMGGNIEKLGLISEYGIYACPHYMTKRILGFYIPASESLTEEGKRVLLDRYPNAKLLGVTNGAIHKVLTTEETQKKAQLISDAVERGAVKAQVEGNTIDELDGLIKALDSGKHTVAEVVDSKNELEDVVGYEPERGKPVATTAKRKPARRR